MKLLFYFAVCLLTADIVSAQIRCPGGRQGGRRCSRFFPDLSCPINEYCYDPFIDILGNGVCCSRGFCPSAPVELCSPRYPRCTFDFDCPPGRNCCPQLCGRRCGEERPPSF